jgi:hypothetical protein
MDKNEYRQQAIDLTALVLCMITHVKVSNSGADNERRLPHQPEFINHNHPFT